MRAPLVLVLVLGGCAPADDPRAPAAAARALPADATAWAAVGRTVVLEREGRIEVHRLGGCTACVPLPGRPKGEARVSPRGDAVAVALEVGGATDVYVLELGGREPRLHRLTSGGGFAPRWVGASRLVYESPRKDGGFGLFVRAWVPCGGPEDPMQGKGGLGPEQPFWEAPPAAREDAQPLPRPVVQA